MRHLILFLPLIFTCSVESSGFGINIVTPMSGGSNTRLMNIACISVGTHFSISPSNIVDNNFSLPESNVLLYNYGFDMGLVISKVFTGNNWKTEIREFDLTIGTDYYKSGFNEYGTNTIFIIDSSRTSYKIDRTFIHNTSFVTLNSKLSLSFSFLPNTILLVSGVRFGYKFSELYENIYTTEHDKISNFIPNDSEKRIIDNKSTSFLIKKQPTDQNYLLGLRLGIAFQIRTVPHIYDEEGNVEFARNIVSYLNVWTGIEYNRANLLGNISNDYFFYGVNVRYVLPAFPF